MRIMYLWCLLSLPGGLFAADEFSGTIQRENPQQSEIIEFRLPDGADTKRRWELTGPGDRQIATQPVIGDASRRVVLLRPHELNQQYQLRVIPADRVDPLPPIIRGPHVTDRDGQLHLYDSPREILSYHTAESQPPEGIAPHFARSGHIHPLRTPSGEIVTAEFPADHAHQHGVFFAWVNTQFAGHKVDFWNQGAKLGNVRHTKLTESVAGKLFAGFESQLEHLDLTMGEKVVLHETWKVMAFSLRAADDMPYFLVDLESRQIAATDTPLLVQKYHYGGFGWRGPMDWLSLKETPPGQGCTFLTSLGDDRIKGNHTRPDWVAVTGEVDHHPCTVAIYGSPTNFRHPQPVRLHPDKPYFCFAPCVLGEFTIERYKPLVSRYRIVTHAGPAQPELYTDLVRSWSQPAVIEWVPAKP